MANQSNTDKSNSKPLDRTRSPTAAPAARFRFPEFRKTTLPGDLQLITARRQGNPAFYAEVVLPAGAEHEPLSRAGLGTFAIALMDEGTRSRSSTQIALEVEDTGGFLTTSAGWNAAYLAFGGLDTQLRPLLEMSGDVLANAAFEDSEIDRLKAERLTEIARRSADPGSIATRAVGHALYRGSLYSEPLIGTSAALRDVGRREIVEFYNARATRGGSTLVVVGDVDHDGVAELIADGLAEWSGKVSKPASIAEPTPLDGTEVHLYDRPDATQTELRVAQVGVPRSHPDHETLVVLNSILGGKFTSRLNLNLREEKGFTYGVHSRFARRRGRGPFMIQTALSTENVGEAVREIFHEVERLRSEPVPTDELNHTRDYVVGVFPYTLQTNEGLAQRLVDQVVHDLPIDYFDRYIGRIESVDDQAILQAAQDHLDPAQMVIIAVGPADLLRPQLEEFGSLTVHELPSTK